MSGYRCYFLGFFNLLLVRDFCLVGVQPGGDSLGGQGGKLIASALFATTDNNVRVGAT